jgi:polyisoprenyl-phosphate glycosyltransferase
MTKSVDCSIIIPVYFNEHSLNKLYESLRNEIFIKNQTITFETIFVDDGSTDNSLNVMVSVKNKYSEDIIKIIRLTRNFGQVNAIFAGLKNASGTFFVNMSADLQDPPELINEMIRYYKEEDYEIVIGSRSDREDSYYRKLTSKIFYSIIRKLSFPNMPQGGFDFILYGNKTRDFIIKNFDANPFLQGMLLWTGYKMISIPYIRKDREEGKSKWTFTKKIKYLLDGILSYSFFPIRLISFFGIIIALLGFTYAIVIIVARIIGNVPFKGWAPLMIVILLLSGLQMIMLGIIGEYLWRTFAQVKNKEPYMIDKIID